MYVFVIPILVDPCLIKAPPAQQEFLKEEWTVPDPFAIKITVWITELKERFNISSVRPKSAIWGTFCDGME